MKINSLVVAIYFHPEAYPPVLNMLNMLGRNAGSVKVVHRPHLVSQWNYPPTVELVPAGKLMTAKQQEESSLLAKVGLFIQFVIRLYKTCRRSRPDWIMLNDPLSALAYQAIRPLLKHKPATWYHSHDVADMGHIRKFSLSWLAARGESKLFHRLNLFSVPALERLTYYPINKLVAKPFIVPNYPSLSVYKKFLPETNKGDTIKLIYQGRISKGHCFESLIKVLGNSINGRPLSLTLIGPLTAGYRKELETLAREASVEDHLILIEPVPYEELPSVTRRHHIGLAVHEPVEVIYQTGGTASNKIYEYAALGLPVLLFDTPHYRQHLGGHTWAFFVDGTPGSFLKEIACLMNDYDNLSARARSEWETTLNYESVFRPVLQMLTANQTN